MKKTMALVLALLLALTGCGRQDAQPEQPQKTVVAIVKAMDSLHWLSVEDGMRKAADDYDVDLTILWPEKESDAEVQMQILQDAIVSKPDAIALAPCDSEAMQPHTKQIEENGIELFYIDEEAEEGNEYPYVGSDNYFSGKMAAQALAEALPEGAKVAVIGGSQSQRAHYKRANGFKDFVEQETTLQFLEISEVPGCTLTGGRNAMQQLLEKYPDIQGVFCASAMMVMGALEQCRDSDREDIRLVGMDTQSDALTAVKNGTITAMVSQDGYDMGYRMIQTIVAKLDGEPISNTTYVKNMLITQENVDTFLKEYMTEGRK
ncbi:sugar ABC transporter substrate-binding protein [Butyricicoccus sp.]|uniref:sugar ABC transporter substrate-binding protein n=1 Tax=Butyricicoccus sp. TaxID=2049021 RepID=UPI003F136CFD